MALACFGSNGLSKINTKPDTFSALCGMCGSTNDGTGDYSPTTATEGFTFVPSKGFGFGRCRTPSLEEPHPDNEFGGQGAGKDVMGATPSKRRRRDSPQAAGMDSEEEDPNPSVNGTRSYTPDYAWAWFTLQPTHAAVWATADGAGNLAHVIMSLPTKNNRT